MLVPSGAVVKQFVQTNLHKLLARVGAALESTALTMLLYSVILITVILYLIVLKC